MQKKVTKLWKCEKNTFWCVSKETKLLSPRIFLSLSIIPQSCTYLQKRKLSSKLAKSVKRRSWKSTFIGIETQPIYTRLDRSEEVLKDSDSSFHYLYWPWLTDVLLGMNAIIWGRLAVQPWIKCRFTIEAHSSWIRRYNGMKAFSPALHSLSTRLGYIFSDGIRLIVIGEALTLYRSKNS